jgi:hypothetical protein
MHVKVLQLKKKQVCKDGSKLDGSKLKLDQLIESDLKVKWGALNLGLLWWDWVPQDGQIAEEILMIQSGQVLNGDQGLFYGRGWKTWV